jgi:hypothetical protein
MAIRRIKLSKELKDALSELPDQEKDKLIFRLLPANPDLAKKLAFELLEGGDTKGERRRELAEEIELVLKRSTANYYSPGYLLLDLRACSGAISRHVKTTKDKYGEIELNLLVLNAGLMPVREKIAAASPAKARTLSNHVVKRALKIYQLLSKQHPDIVLDFKSDLQELGANISAIDTFMRVAIREGLDVNWLLKGILPDYEI